MINECVYCGHVASTRDHIPTKNLLLSTKNCNLITVPACRNCNSGFQKDEEYFRMFLTAYAHEYSSTARDVFSTKITRSIQRKPSLGHSFFFQMSKIELIDDAGIGRGLKTAIKITENDHRRIKLIREKYIKGLFFHEFSTRLPEDWIIENYWLTNEATIKMAIPTLKQMRWVEIEKDVFGYGVTHVPYTFQSIWCLKFYGLPTFYVYVFDKGLKERGLKKTQRT